MIRAFFRGLGRFLQFIFTPNTIMVIVVAFIWFAMVSIENGDSVGRAVATCLWYALFLAEALLILVLFTIGVAHAFHDTFAPHEGGDRFSATNMVFAIFMVAAIAGTMTYFGWDYLTRLEHPIRNAFSNRIWTLAYQGSDAIMGCFGMMIGLFKFFVADCIGAGIYALLVGIPTVVIVALIFGLHRLFTRRIDVW